MVKSLKKRKRGVTRSFYIGFMTEVVDLKKRIIAAAMLVTVMLVGCGNKGDGVVTAGNEAGSGMEAATDAGSTDESSDSDNGESLGNGSFFVSVNGKVYFRKYDADTFSEETLNSEYTSFGMGSLDTDYSEKSEIYVYNPKAKTAEKFLDDNGYGEIYYCDGSLYLNKRENGADSVYKVNIDTKEVSPAGDMKGKIVGVDEQTKVFVTKCVDDGDEKSSINVYKDGELLISKTAEDWGGYLGVYDGKAYCYFGQYSENDPTEFTIWELNSADKSEICLGKIIPQKEVDGANEFLTNWEVEELLKDNNKLYIRLADYEGSGSFYNAGMCLEATEGTENSLKIMYNSAQMDEGKMHLDSEGKVAFVPYVKGDYEVSGFEVDYEDPDFEEKFGSYGDLMYFEKDDNEVRIAKDFIKKQPKESGFEQMLARNAITRIGDTTYMMLPNYVREDIGDIGWRYNYKILKVSYLAVSDNGEIAIIDAVDTSDNNIEVEASYASDSGKLSVTCVGVPINREEKNEVRGENTFVYELSDDVMYVEDGNAKSKEDFVNYIGNGTKRFKIYFNNDGKVNKIEKM